jgi:hypothetical protein
MSVLIIERLKSSPESFRSGEEATLQLLLQSQNDDGEQATIEYRLNPNNDVVFAENGGKVIKETFEVASVPTVAKRSYALTGPGGRSVTITGIVLPERLERSKETVVILK